MTVGGYTLATRAILLTLGIVALVLAVGFTVRSCDKRHSQAAQSRVEGAEDGAFANSAGDAVNAVSGVGQNEAASDSLTRSNERSIRDAEGSTDKVNPASRDAGFASLCKRPSFRNSATGRLRCTNPQ
jgi:hypothetical protein